MAEGECKPLAQAKASFSAPGATAREIIMSGVIRLGPEAQLLEEEEQEFRGEGSRQRHQRSTLLRLR